MFEIRKSLEFSAAHALRDYVGPCAAPRHNYRVEAIVRGEALDPREILMTSTTSIASWPRRWDRWIIGPERGPSLRSGEPDRGGHRGLVLRADGGARSRGHRGRAVLAAVRLWEPRRLRGLFGVATSEGRPPPGGAAPSHRPPPPSWPGRSPCPARHHRFRIHDPHDGATPGAASTVTLQGSMRPTRGLAERAL